MYVTTMFVLAAVTFISAGTKTIEKGWWGRLPGVDQAAVTDTVGQFISAASNPDYSR